jgi:hypothetical protein
MFPHGHRIDNLLPPIQLQNNIKQWADDIDEGMPFSIIEWRGLEDLPSDIKEQITHQAHQWLLISSEERKKRLENNYEPRILTPLETQNIYLHGEYGLIASQDIEIYTVLGPYAGRFLNDIQIAVQEYQQYDGDFLEKYLHGCDKEGYPAISAYQSGNSITLINDWRPCDFKERSDLASFQKEKQGCQAIIGQWGRVMRCPFFVSIRKIASGEEILGNYGSGYWSK